MSEDESLFYVATDGNDAWSGRLDSANGDGTDGPFASLHAARDAAREHRPTDGDRTVPVTIMVRGGKYFPERTLKLTDADGGTQSAPVTYRAYPGETPVISGGRRITGWSAYKDGIYRCELPETRGRGLFFRQLFANGERQIRARYPNLDSDSTRWNGRWAQSKQDDAANEAVAPYIVWDEPDAFQREWTRPTQGEIYLLPSNTMWGDSALIPIASVDPANRRINLRHGMRDFDRNPVFVSQRVYRPECCRFVVENILEELDQPGEWCLDTEDGILYFWPPHEDIEALEIVVPVVQCLVHLEDTSHVAFSGFVLTETRGGQPSSHYDDVDGVGPMRAEMGWEYCGETVYLNNCRDCCIEKNRILNVGGNGIYLRHHNERNQIRRNEIGRAGSNGVVLAGGIKTLSYGGWSTSGTPHPTFNEVTDNSIHHIGLVDTYAAGIFLGQCNWNRIEHNEIHDVPHHGINLGNSRCGRNYIEYNRICRAGFVTNDNAAINCWHELPQEVEPPGHVIRYNYISETGNPDTDGHSYSLVMGIYLDNWSSNCLVYGNVIVNTAVDGNGYGILAKGHNNIIENNLLVNSGSIHICIMAHCNYPEFATVLERNILCDLTGGMKSLMSFEVLTPEPDYTGKMWMVILRSDYNLFFDASTENPAILPDVPFSDWSRLFARDENEYDGHSIVVDPLVEETANGDYMLRSDSPALALGFHPIDTSRIGVRREHEGQ